MMDYSLLMEVLEAVGETVFLCVVFYCLLKEE